MHIHQEDVPREALEVVSFNLMLNYIENYREQTEVNKKMPFFDFRFSFSGSLVFKCRSNGMGGGCTEESLVKTLWRVINPF